MHRLLLCLLLIHSAYAQSPDNAEKQSHAFMQTFLATCAAYGGDQEALRAAIGKQNAAQLKPEAAQLFGGGLKGEAWHIPSGAAGKNFVLFVAAEKNFCALSGDETDIAQTERLFVEYAHLPEKENIFEVIKREDSYENSAGGVKVHMLTFQWKKPDNPRSIVLSLSTSSNAVQATLAFVRE